MAECGRHAVSGGPEAEANDRREGMDSPGFTLHAKNRHRAGFRLAGLRPLVLRVANGYTRNTGLLPVFAWRASARWCCAWLRATQSCGESL